MIDDQEALFLEFLKPLWTNGSHVFDVGAASGAYSECLRYAFTKCKLHIFEPREDAAAALQSKFPRATVSKVAIGDYNGHGKFVVAPNPEHSHSRDFLTRDGDVIVDNVPYRTIDDYCITQDVDEIFLLKIDTEGNEQAVLHGAEKMLRHGAIKAIQFEYGSTWLFLEPMTKIVEWLDLRGYNCFEFKDGQLVPYLPVNDLAWRNVFALRKDL